MHRPAGKPGTPRGSISFSQTTISDDHFSAPRKKMSKLQRLQRQTRSSHKRGRRSSHSYILRKAHRSASRANHRRSYRWCKSHIGQIQEDRDRPRLGNGGLDLLCSTASQSLKDTPSAGRDVYEDHLANRKRSPQLHKIPYGYNFVVATLNVCSLLKATMHQQIVLYMRTKQIEILCLQETKVKRTSYYMVDSYTFYTFSNCGATQQEHYGMGFVLSPLARRALLRTLPSTSRVAGLSFHTGAGEFSVLSGYAPHNQHTEDTKQHFYDELGTLLDGVETRGPLIVLGDFNARIHGRLHDESPIYGLHIFGKGVHFVGGDTDNRAFLTHFCQLHHLRMSNTFFEHPPSRQVTYKEVGTTTLPPSNACWSPHKFAQLDLCLTPGRWKNIVQDVVSDPWANVDSDHFPVLTKVKLVLGARKLPAPRPRWDFQTVLPGSVQALNQNIENNLPVQHLGDDPTTRWDALREVYLNALDQHIPKQARQPLKPWISQGTLDLIARRGEARNHGDLTQVAQYNRDIKRAARRDRKHWLDDRLRNADWEPIKQLKQPFPTKMVRLDAPPQLGPLPSNATNADIFAAHLEQVQWAPVSSSKAIDIKTDALPGEAPTIDEGPFTMPELMEAIKRLKSGKSPFKHVGDKVRVLTLGVNRWW